VVKAAKFSCTLNFLLLETLAVMATFLSGYKGKYRDNEAGECKDNETSSSRQTACKQLNTENTIQNMSLLDSQILILMENIGTSVYFARIFGCGQH
jgi:hypothetical protein